MGKKLTLIDRMKMSAKEQELREKLTTEILIRDITNLFYGKMSKIERQPYNILKYASPAFREEFHKAIKEEYERQFKVDEL